MAAILMNLDFISEARKYELGEGINLVHSNILQHMYNLDCVSTVSQPVRE